MFLSRGGSLNFLTFSYIYFCTTEKLILIKCQTFLQNAQISLSDTSFAGRSLQIFPRTVYIFLRFDPLRCPVSIEPPFFPLKQIESRIHFSECDCFACLLWRGTALSKSHVNCFQHLLYSSHAVLIASSNLKKCHLVQCLRILHCIYWLCAPKLFKSQQDLYTRLWFRCYIQFLALNWLFVCLSVHLQ